ncbi:MAG: hypothetical protein PWR21_1395 [Methanoculleus sp.]|nr:hypothetical protein [Methanoculleus sp.]
MFCCVGVRGGFVADAPQVSRGRLVPSYLRCSNPVCTPVYTRLSPWKGSMGLNTSHIPYTASQWTAHLAVLVLLPFSQSHIATHCPRPCGAGNDCRERSGRQEFKHRQVRARSAKRGRGGVDDVCEALRVETGEGGKPPSPSAPPPRGDIPSKSASSDDRRECEKTKDLRKAGSQALKVQEPCALPVKHDLDVMKPSHTANHQRSLRRDNPAPARPAGGKNLYRSRFPEKQIGRPPSKPQALISDLPHT